MVHDDGRVGLDEVQVAFDDERVVCDAGVMLAATLAERLDVEGLVEDCVHLGIKGAASRAGRKVMALVYAMVLGADSIDDCDVLRSGRTGRLLGGWIPAPSTLGTFLRAFTFGHVRQLDLVVPRTCRGLASRRSSSLNTGRSAADRTQRARARQSPRDEGLLERLTRAAGRARSRRR